MTRRIDRLRAVFETLGQPARGSSFRAVPLRYQSAPLGGVGSRLVGGRYNPKGAFEALYTAETAEGALRELAVVVRSPTDDERYLGLRAARVRGRSDHLDRRREIEPFGFTRVTAAHVQTSPASIERDDMRGATLGGARRRTLEYDDLARIARERDRPFAEIAARIEGSLPPP